jgi:hypothetical protein
LIVIVTVDRWKCSAVGRGGHLEGSGSWTTSNITSSLVDGGVDFPDIWIDEEINTSSMIDDIHGGMSPKSLGVPKSLSSGNSTIVDVESHTVVSDSGVTEDTSVVFLVTGRPD